MDARPLLTIVIVGLAGVGIGLVGAGGWLMVDRLGDMTSPLANLVILYCIGGILATAAIAAGTWAYVDRAVGRPIDALTREIQTVVHANPDHRIDVDAGHGLGALPAAVGDLVAQLASARTRVDAAVTEATEKVRDQKTQLEAILHDLHEGVVVCTIHHAILLYNRRALELLHVGDQVGLDRSLFSFTSRQPIMHALTRLTNRLVGGTAYAHPEGLTVPFLCSTTDGRHTLQGRMGLILDAEEAIAGYVLTFSDRTQELAALGQRDRLLREATEGQRGVIANLRAATEILAEHPDMSVEAQAPFVQVVINETNELSHRIEALTGRYRTVITDAWPTSDIYSANLLNNLVERLRDEGGITAVMTGLPQWLHGDSYTLIELVDRLIHRVSRDTGVTSFDLEAAAGERNVYIDLVYAGRPIPPSELDLWLEERLDEAIGGLTLREVLDHHQTDVWSMAHREGFARLRLPLPPARQPPSGREVRRVPARPEFYDFELLKRTPQLGSQGDRPLKDLSYVVFDTETTGLQPSAGDEVISIAGVRVVNGRILTGESFERLVDPRRVIPRDSVRFHGITEDMVKDKPPIAVVLPQFRDFVGDAILVAHNAAFDLKFIKLKEAESGTSFDMPVLDTLLLSAFLHDHTSKHTLDSIAQRFGVAVRGRHTALGDALATAGIFLKMLDILEARGVTTLREAVDASHRIVEIRAQQAKF